MVPTFRGERNSALATWKGTLLQMFDLSTEGGRTRLRQRSPLRLKALSPPKAPWHRCPPGCPWFWHSTPHRCHPRCPPVALCVVNSISRSSAAWNCCRASSPHRQDKCHQCYTNIFINAHKGLLHVEGEGQKTSSLSRLSIIISMDPHGSKNCAMHHTWL